MDYKDRSKREAVWDNFVRTIWIKMPDKGGSRASAHSSEKSGQGEPLLTERQKWTRDNFDILRDHIMHDRTTKSEFRAPKGSASQASAAAVSSSRWETVHTAPFQDTFRPESTCDPSDIFHLDTHTPTTRSCTVSVMSS